MKQRRTRRQQPWILRQFHRSPKPFWLVAFLHLIALVLALVLFALPHHVIPRSHTSMGVISSRDAAPVNAQEAPVETVDEAQPSVHTQTGDFSAKFADKFTQGNPVQTENTYMSENLNITITEYYVNRTRFYVADFYIRDISCFRTGFAKGQYGRNITENIRGVAYREDSVLSINGDFYGIREGGVCVRNGELFYSDDVVREICVLYWDGSIQCFPMGEFNCDREMANGAYQIWNFGPAMLDAEGNPRPEFDEIYEGIYGNQPRSALGYFEPGHYCFITADGRSDDSRGLTMDQLGLLAQNLGCAQCYNMDGGRTAQMAFGTDIVNQPINGGRNCSDYLTIVDRVS